jgi:hypothetical protein
MLVRDHYIISTSATTRHRQPQRGGAYLSACVKPVLNDDYFIGAYFVGAYFVGAYFVRKFRTGITFTSARQESSSP